MSQRFENAHTSPSDNLLFGVGLASRNDSRHIGILYLSGREWHILHLVGKGLSNDLITNFPRPLVLVKSNHMLDAEDREALAAFARSIVNQMKNNRLDYGLSEYSEWFDLDGTVKEHPPGSGLTCSGFVLAVLDAYNVELVEDSSWPTDRIKDLEFVTGATNYLSKMKNAPEMAKIVSDGLKFVRYRPEEVAGATMADTWPCPFQIAKENSESVLAFLNSLSSHS